MLLDNTIKAILDRLDNDLPVFYLKNEENPEEIHEIKREGIIFSIVRIINCIDSGKAYMHRKQLINYLETINIKNIKTTYPHDIIEIDFVKKVRIN